MKKRRIVVILCVTILFITILYQVVKSINSGNESESSSEVEQRNVDVSDATEEGVKEGIKQEQILYPGNYICQKSIKMIRKN